MQNGSNSIIQPAGFYIDALSSMPYSNIYVMFLTVLYVITIICNVFLISIIFYDHCLHVPKFMAVGNLALVDLFLSTSLMPSMIKTYIVLDNFVPFKLCVVQMYTYYTFLFLEQFSLCILSYERFIMICFALRQESINTNTGMTYINILDAVTSIPILSFCGSLEVHSYFCDYAPVLVLAYSDVCHVYVPIYRFKALVTCTEHLILVALFFIPIVSIFCLTFFFLSFWIPSVGLVSLSLSSLITPCVNPILYSLKTKEIRSRIHSLLTQGLSVHPLGVLSHLVRLHSHQQRTVSEFT
uniref:Odorant receptor, family D, subfamily 108, member 3 n=1 Tax=Sinocyclocheilus rhinocerous TaxID=307959 RepID=A0A673FTW9_9TELE